jgi:[acyl-carrier-protein] S-malonyltransferase
MGKDLYQAYPEARAVFDEADEVLGFPLSRICFEGPKAELDDTLNTQPALFTVSLALWRTLSAVGFAPPIAFVAGHSMGEYSALAVAGAVGFADGLRLVRERGRLMKRAGQRNPGGMAAVLGLADDEVTAICEEVTAQVEGPGVQVANYNCPGQVVISGGQAAVRRASELASERGARRVVPLDVSIAAHSSLMAQSVDEFAAAVQRTSLHVPQIPVVANISARPLTDVQSLRDELVGQLTSSVQWTRSVQTMIERGVNTFVEVGPGNVLIGLVRRIDRGVERYSVGDAGGVREILERFWV